MVGVGVSLQRGRKINPLETATLLVWSLSSKSRWRVPVHLGGFQKESGWAREGRATTRTHGLSPTLSHALGTSSSIPRGRGLFRPIRDALAHVGTCYAIAQLSELPTPSPAQKWTSDPQPGSAASSSHITAEAFLASPILSVGEGNRALELNSSYNQTSLLLNNVKALWNLKCKFVLIVCASSPCSSLLLLSSQDPTNTPHRCPGTQALLASFTLPGSIQRRFPARTPLAWVFPIPKNGLRKLQAARLRRWETPRSQDVGVLLHLPEVSEA